MEWKIEAILKNLLKRPSFPEQEYAILQMVRRNNRYGPGCLIILGIPFIIIIVIVQTIKDKVTEKRIKRYERKKLKTPELDNSSGV